MQPLQPCPVCNEGRVGVLTLSDGSQVKVCEKCLCVWPTTVLQLTIESSIDALNHYLDEHKLTIAPEIQAQQIVRPTQGPLMPGQFR